MNFVVLLTEGSAIVGSAMVSLPPAVEFKISARHDRPVPETCKHGAPAYAAHQFSGVIGRIECFMTECPKPLDPTMTH